MSEFDVLVIGFSNLHRDPRIIKQIDSLTKKYTLCAAGFSPPPSKKTCFVELKRSRKNLIEKILKAICLKFRLYEIVYWKHSLIQESFDKLSNVNSKVILANDIESLPLAVKLAKRNKAKILFDAHEYAPKQFEDIYKWRFFYQKYMYFLCRRYLPSADRMLTVAEGIAEQYYQNFDIRPQVIWNAPKRSDLTPSTINPEAIQIVHHGGAAPSRQLELLINLIDHLDERFHLNLILLPSDERYLSKIKKMAKDKSRIKFWEPVPTNQISQFINRFDIGVCFSKPLSFNLLHCLPNKFFEFIQARLALAVSPLPEMEKILNNYKNGIVSKSFEIRDLADQLNILTTQDIQILKNNSHKAASDLCFEHSEKILNSNISALMPIS